MNLSKRVKSMTFDKNTIINDLAENIRGALGIAGDMFDMDELVAGLGGEIIYADNCICEEKIVKTGCGSFAVYIDGTATGRRRRFAAARELGHLFMHMQYGNDEWDRFKAGECHKPPGRHMALEEEANAFAAALLMPADKFREIAVKTSADGYYHPEKIAEYFDTYGEAAVFRGKNLGLWE
jgi:hypothetical protein